MGVGLPDGHDEGGVQGGGEIEQHWGTSRRRAVGPSATLRIAHDECVSDGGQRPSVTVPLPPRRCHSTRYGTEPTSGRLGDRASTDARDVALPCWAPATASPTSPIGSRAPSTSSCQGEDWATRGNMDEFLDEVEGFVHSIRAEQASFDRVLATVLFTDIVGSTQRAADLGDAEWKELLERHHETVRAMIGRYRGMEIDTTGDGFLATFDGPARGVQCAQAIVEAVGLRVRDPCRTAHRRGRDDRREGRRYRRAHRRARRSARGTLRGLRFANREGPRRRLGT